MKFSEAKRDVYRDARESIQKIGDDFDRDVDRIMTDFHKRMDEQDAERAKAWAEIDVQQDNIDRMLDGLEAGHKK